MYLMKFLWPLDEDVMVDIETQLRAITIKKMTCIQSSSSDEDAIVDIEAQLRAITRV